jgi:hypothetical protein
VLQELLTLGALVLFLLWFPRLLLRTWATGHYAGIGVTLKPRRPRVGPGPVASTVLAGFRLARFVMQRVFAPAVAAGSRRLINTAARRRRPHEYQEPRAERWRRWRNHWPSGRSAPASSEPGFLDYTPDNFDTWERL